MIDTLESAIRFIAGWYLGWSTAGFIRACVSYEIQQRKANR